MSTFNMIDDLPIIDVIARYFPLNGIAHPSGTVPEAPVRALIDTGANAILMSPAIIDKLELQYIRDFKHTITGQPTVELRGYAADFVLSTSPLCEATDRIVLRQEMSGYDVIFGRSGMKVATWTFAPDGTFWLTP